MGFKQKCKKKRNGSDVIAGMTDTAKDVEAVKDVIYDNDEEDEDLEFGLPDDEDLGYVAWNEEEIYDTITGEVGIVKSKANLSEKKTYEQRIKEVAASKRHAKSKSQDVQGLFGIAERYMSVPAKQSLLSQRTDTIPRCHSP